jgi:hypothetical protein
MTTEKGAFAFPGSELGTEFELDPRTYEFNNAKELVRFEKTCR